MAKSKKGIKKREWKHLLSMEAPNYWSTGLYVPYMVEFHFWDGWIERVKV